MEIKQTAKQFDIKTSDIKTSDIKASDIETSEIEAFEIEAFELKALGQHFPPMPEELRSMVEQEVRKQMGTTSPIRRRNYKARKVLIATLAAVMLLGTTVAAGVAYRMHTEKVGKYAAKTSIESMTPQTNHVTADAPMTQKDTLQNTALGDIALEVSYLPEGMVKTEDGKYSYSDNLYKGGVTVAFYKMDTGDAQFEMLTTGVKETETVKVNGYDGVYYVLYGGEDGEVCFNQRIYVAYTDVHYVMEMFAASDVPKEEALKIAEGVRLTPASDEMSQELVHAYQWSEYLKSKTEPQTVETWASDISIPKSAMANTHAVGETFSAVSVPVEEDWRGLNQIEIKVADVQVRDDVSLLDLSMFDSEDREELQQELDSSGKLLPAKINYIKYGDGIHSLNEVVDSRVVPQKLVYVTVEYTNTGTKQLEEVLFFGNLMKITEENGQMICYKGKSSDEHAEWDEAVPQGAAHRTEMWYYDVHGGERNNNYITKLGAGKTETVHMAWLVPEEELSYLYLDLNTSGSSFEFCEESLAVGYVDIRQ